MHALKRTMITLTAFFIVMSVQAYADTKTGIKADPKTSVKEAWQSYLMGKNKHAAKELKRLAKDNDAHAQNYLGSLYASGHGVK